MNPSTMPRYINTLILTYEHVLLSWLFFSFNYYKECRRKRHSVSNASSFISLDSLLEASLVSLSSPVNSEFPS